MLVRSIRTPIVLSFTFRMVRKLDAYRVSVNDRWGLGNAYIVEEAYSRKSRGLHPGCVQSPARFFRNY